MKTKLRFDWASKDWAVINVGGAIKLILTIKRIINFSYEAVKIILVFAIACYAIASLLLAPCFIVIFISEMLSADSSLSEDIYFFLPGSVMWALLATYGLLESKQ